MGEGEARGGERPQGRAGEVPVLSEPGRVGCWRRGEFALQIASWAGVPSESAGAGPLSHRGPALSVRPAPVGVSERIEAPVS